MGLPQGTVTGQVLIWSAAANAWVVSAPSNGKINMRASLQGNAMSTPGRMQFFANNSGNPGGIIDQTSVAGPGINNGGSAPMVMPACTLVKASLTYAHASVLQVSTGSSMTARFRLQNLAYSSRATLVDMDFPVTNADISNDVTSDQFSQGITLDLDESIEVGALLGIEFISRFADNDEISSMGGMHVYLEFDL